MIIVNCLLSAPEHVSGAGTENGAEWVRKSGERERGLKKIRWSGRRRSRERERSGDRGYRNKCDRWAEISTVPAPLTCSGRLYYSQLCRCTYASWLWMWLFECLYTIITVTGQGSQTVGHSSDGSLLGHGALSLTICLLCCHSSLTTEQIKTTECPWSSSATSAFNEQLQRWWHGRCQPTHAMLTAVPTTTVWSHCTQLWTHCLHYWWLHTDPSVTGRFRPATVFFRKTKRFWKTLSFALVQSLNQSIGFLLWYDWQTIVV